MFSFKKQSYAGNKFSFSFPQKWQALSLSRKKSGFFSREFDLIFIQRGIINEYKIYAQVSTPPFAFVVEHFYTQDKEGTTKGLRALNWELKYNELYCRVHILRVVCILMLISVPTKKYAPVTDDFRTIL